MAVSTASTCPWAGEPSSTISKTSSTGTICLPWGTCRRTAKNHRKSCRIREAYTARTRGGNFSLTGSFGGNDWAIAQPDGSPDKLGYLDWRVTLGWERKMNGGAGLHFEIGYVFSREIRFASTPDILNPDDTLLLRAGFAF